MVDLSNPIVSERKILVRLKSIYEARVLEVQNRIKELDVRFNNE